MVRKVPSDLGFKDHEKEFSRIYVLQVPRPLFPIIHSFISLVSDLSYRAVSDSVMTFVAFLCDAAPLTISSRVTGSVSRVSHARVL